MTNLLNRKIEDSIENKNTILSSTSGRIHLPSLVSSS